MKTEFKTLYKLSVVLMMCGLVLFIYTGCGGYDEAEEAEGTYAAQGASFGLIPPNGAAYNDVFFKDYGTNPLIDTEDDHLSTFGMDVDTLNSEAPPEAVRVEEFVNTFDYNYPPPCEAFAVHVEGAPSRFGEGGRVGLPRDRKRLRFPRDDEQLHLLRIGIQGRVVPDENRKDAMLTFVIDVSGSMAIENRLELVKRERLIPPNGAAYNDVFFKDYGLAHKSTY